MKNDSVTSPLTEKPPVSTNYRITFEPMGIFCQAPDGKTIMDIATGQGIFIRSDCGGQGQCGQCLVAVNPIENLSPPTQNECDLLSNEQIAAGYRLACEAEIKGPVRITIAESALDSKEAVGKTGIDAIFPCDPLIQTHIVKAGTTLRTGHPVPRDYARLLQNRLRETGNTDCCFDDLDVLKMLGSPPFHQSDITVVSHVDKGVTAVLTGIRTQALGIALDIGTTTLAAYLCDLETGRLLASSATANPQRRFGEDVISRISFANEHASGTTKLQAALMGDINALIRNCAEKADAAPLDIAEVSVVGNTTMQQIFMGDSPPRSGSVAISAGFMRQP